MRPRQGSWVPSPKPEVFSLKGTVRVYVLGLRDTTAWMENQKDKKVHECMGTGFTRIM